jgi:predicted acyltransferase
MSAESPLLATGLPCAKTVLDPLLIFAGWALQQQGGHGKHGMMCGSNLSPGLRTLIPLMNTLLAVALHPIEVVQRCPVLARSILSLDIAGIVLLFIDTKNRWYYNLNLENWPFFTSCFIPPTI